MHDRQEANYDQGPPREYQAQRTAGVSNVKGGRKVYVPGLARQGNVKPGLLANPRPRGIRNGRVPEHVRLVPDKLDQQMIARSGY